MSNILVRSYRRRKPYLERREAPTIVPKVSDLVKQVEDRPRMEFEEQLAKEWKKQQAEAAQLKKEAAAALEGVDAEVADVKSAQAVVKLEVAKVGEIREELKEVPKKLGGSEARREAKRLKANLRAQQLAVQRSKTALKREKEEADLAKQSAKQAGVALKVQKEELSRVRLGTKLEAVEKKRAIEESKEKLRKERMTRKEVRRQEKVRKHKGRKKVLGVF